MVGRILLSLAAFALTGFVVLTLIGLWDRYEQENQRIGIQRPLRALSSITSRLCG
jgi:uncharacterized membrane protein YqjE